MNPGATATVLSMSDIEKRFPGVHALKQVSIDIKPGEVVGLIGENGAGKSTLMKILSGVYQPDAGTISIAGKATRLENSADANRKGIGMVFQEQSLLPNLSVAENIYLGAETQFTRFGLIQWRALYAAAARQLEKVNVDVDPRTRAEELSFATRQMVELAKALTLEEHATGHLLILLDEPTSVLERAEIDKGVDGPYVAAVHFQFDSLEAMTTALSGDGSAQVTADVANYTNITPVVQVSEVV